MYIKKKLYFCNVKTNNNNKNERDKKTTVKRKKNQQSINKLLTIKKQTTMKPIRIEINQIAAIKDKKLTKQMLVREINRGKENDYQIMEDAKEFVEWLINTKLK